MGIEAQRRQPLRASEGDPDVRGEHLLEQRQAAGHDVVHLGDHQVGRLVATQHQQLSGQLAGAPLGLRDHLEVLSLRLAEGLGGDETGAVADDGEQVAEVVSHPARQQPQALQPLALRALGLQSAPGPRRAREARTARSPPTPGCRGATDRKWRPRRWGQPPRRRRCPPRIPSVRSTMPMGTLTTVRLSSRRATSGVSARSRASGMTIGPSSRRRAVDSQSPAAGAAGSSSRMAAALGPATATSSACCVVLAFDDVQPGVGQAEAGCQFAAHELDQRVVVVDATQLAREPRQRAVDGSGRDWLGHGRMIRETGCPTPASLR